MSTERTGRRDIIREALKGATVVGTGIGVGTVYSMISIRESGREANEYNPHTWDTAAIPNPGLVAPYEFPRNNLRFPWNIGVDRLFVVTHDQPMVAFVTALRPDSQIRSFQPGHESVYRNGLQKIETPFKPKIDGNDASITDPQLGQTVVSLEQSIKDQFSRDLRLPENRLLIETKQRPDRGAFRALIYRPQSFLYRGRPTPAGFPLLQMVFQ